MGFVAPAPARLLFWTLEIASGLFVLQSALYLLTRRFGASRLPSWSLVLLSGVLGAIVLTPIYWLIGEGLMEGWLGYPALPDDEEDDPASFLASHPLLEEFVHIVGPVTAAWVLICIPRLHRLVPPSLHGPRQPTDAMRHRQGAPAASDPATGAATAGSDSFERRGSASAPSAEATRLSGVAEIATSAAFGSAPVSITWCERLPTQLGRDVIAVASELQYLRVWTTRGCALVLGSLAEVEAEGASHGLRVHRSWWVAFEHVISVRRTSSGAVCLMSDGRQVPVSRRRRAEVLARFGDGVQYRQAAGSEAVAEADLH